MTEGREMCIFDVGLIRICLEPIIRGVDFAAISTLGMSIAMLVPASLEMRLRIRMQI